MGVQCTEVVSGPYFQDLREEGAGLASSGLQLLVDAVRAQRASVTTGHAELPCAHVLPCRTVDPYAHRL